MILIIEWSPESFNESFRESPAMNRFDFKFNLEDSVPLQIEKLGELSIYILARNPSEELDASAQVNEPTIRQSHL